MKTQLSFFFAGALIIQGMINAPFSYSQKQDAVVKKYLTHLPPGNVVDNKTSQKYRMTAVYTNMDLYGNFIDKTKVTGDYSRQPGSGYATWNNVFISNSNKKSEPFPVGTKQEYMENMRYDPSGLILSEELFKDFPAGSENVFARNLIWDMKGLEAFAWSYLDSLKLNINYIVPDITGSFNMADIGTYEHAEIQVCWTGISMINNEFCAILDFRAMNNKIKMSMDQLKTQGTEQYWGTIWISLKTRQIEYAEMYGGTAQEIEITGLKNKLLIKTIRELRVDRNH